MNYKLLLHTLKLSNGKLVGYDEPAIEVINRLNCSGLDGFIIYDLSKEDYEHDLNIGVIKDICKTTGLPVYAGGNIKRFEDVKKLLYAGCEKAIISAEYPGYVKALKESFDRFGLDKLLFLIDNKEDFCYEEVNGKVSGIINMQEEIIDKDIPQIVDMSCKEATTKVLNQENIIGVTGSLINDILNDIYQYKFELKDAGINVRILESNVSFFDMKLDENGLIPVIVQDYQTNEVLMMAYMNEEAFNLTLKTGLMTYYSRSRKEIWVKGLTSGHYQYVKSLSIDCDKDTILAKVYQLGAACHTGNRSCFYTEMVNDSVEKLNPLQVFDSVYSVIADRKVNPKEGSYTNYLFDKGIDKILKKLGEEATEIVIAAKNPDAEEIKYEVSDFLYHLMVLMVERGVSWEDITEELAKR